MSLRCLWHVYVSRVFFSSSWLCCCNFQTSKSRSGHVFQCKCSGAGQNEIKLSCILFCKGKYGTVYVGNWTLSSFFVPEGPQTKMGHGWPSGVRSSYMSREEHSGDFIFPVLSWKDRVKGKVGLYGETQKVSVRLRAVGDFRTQDALTALGHCHTRGKGLNAC